MLKNRQEGLTTLHSIWVTIALSVVFIEFTRLMQLTGWVELAHQSRLNVCFFAVFVGTVVSLRAYHHGAAKLAHLTWAEAFRLTRQQMIRVALVLFAFVFATKDRTTSRLFLVGFLAAATVVLALCNRYLPILICRVVFQTNTVPTIFIGAPESISRLRHWISGQSNMGIDPVGFLTIGSEGHEPRTDTPHLGHVRDLEKTLRAGHIGQIIVLQDYLTRAQTREVIASAQKFGCRLHIFNNWAEELSHPIVVDQAGDHTFFTLDDEPLENPLNRMFKRAFDIAFALPVIAFLLPPLVLAVWFFQRRQSPGPLFYTQPRTGMTGQRFNIIKFRTMNAQPPAKEAQQATPGDARIFPFGRLLRHTSLDEFPQFINVLLGDMSVSGPRPHLLQHDEDFSRMLQPYYTRQYVKPGIAGLAQCKGFRGEISEVGLLEKRIRFDVFYINNWCFLLDLQIILSAAKQVLFPPKTAY